MRKSSLMSANMVLTLLSKKYRSSCSVADSAVEEEEKEGRGKSVRDKGEKDI